MSNIRQNAVMVLSLVGGLWINEESVEAQTAVYTQTLTQESSPSSANERQVIASSRLSSCSGCNQVRVKFSFNSGGNGGPYNIGTVWIGQSTGTAGDFTGDQVQFMFGGNSTFVALNTTGGTVTSDYVTLSQNWDNTKSYTISFHVPNVGGNLAAQADFLSNVTVWNQINATDQSGNTTIDGQGYGSGIFGLMITEIDGQASGGGGGGEKVLLFGCCR
jgi:hypothetical protein